MILEIEELSNDNPLGRPDFLSFFRVNLKFF